MLERSITMVLDSNYEFSPKPTDSMFIPMADKIQSSIIEPNDNLPKEILPSSIKEGSFRITFRPNSGNYIYKGTMRVDKYDNTISGDLYQFLDRPNAWLDTIFPFLSPIPIYPRNRYFSYLKAIGISWVPSYSMRPAMIELTIEEYKYQQPPEGSYNGSFSKSPNRKFMVYLTPVNSRFGFSDSFFMGNLTEGGINKGEFSMKWTSPFFRKATLQINTTPGAIAPMPVKAKDGYGTETFRTIFSSAGWDLKTIYNPKTIFPPPGTTTLAGEVCPSTSDLDALLSSIKMPRNYLDHDWRLQLLVVPGTMGCSRGIMFDNNRKGAATFSNDGYPKSDSPNFGIATDKKQWQVPRAFLRSAAHEVGHGFNQQHQDLTELGEPGPDNSIMTTSPDVANFLANPTSGLPGVFPKDINLRFNRHVRHHLIHFPDPVVRPGAMDFAAGHITTVPEAD